MVFPPNMHFPRLALPNPSEQQQQRIDDLIAEDILPQENEQKNRQINVIWASMRIVPSNIRLAHYFE